MTSRTGLSRGWGALCGLLAAALAMGIAQLIAGLSVPAASPVIDVGSVAINHTPLPVKVWATSTFGNNDKTVLLAGVFIVVFLYAMLVGALAARWVPLGWPCSPASGSRRRSPGTARRPGTRSRR